MVKQRKKAYIPSAAREVKIVVADATAAAEAVKVAAEKAAKAAQGAADAATAASNEAAKIVANATAKAAAVLSVAADKAREDALLALNGEVKAAVHAAFETDKIKKLVSEAVHDVFTDAGLDMDHPLEMQRDFGHLRSMRVLTEKATHRAILTVVSLVVLGVAAALLTGLGVPTKILAFLGLGSIGGSSN